MKRIVLLLAAFSLIAGQALFAQDDGLKITGLVETGLHIEGNNYESRGLGAPTNAQQTANDNAYDVVNFSKGVAYMYNDTDDVPSRNQITFDYTKGNVGASIRFRHQYSANGAHNLNTPAINEVFLGHAYGYFNFLGDIFQISAGFLNNGKWGTVTGFHIDDNLDNKNFVKLEIKPIEGLSFGVNTIDILGRDSGNPVPEFKDVFKTTVYGAKYATDSFGIAAEFTGSNTKYNGIWGKNVDIRNPALLAILRSNPMLGTWNFGTLFSAFVKAVDDNLLVEMDGYFAYGKDDAIPAAARKAHSFGISVRGTFTIDKLDVGAQVDLGLGGGESTASGATNGEGASLWQLGITPKVAYGLTDWLTVGLDIPIGIVDNAKGKGTLMEAALKEWKGGIDFGIKPKASFDLGNGCTVDFFYKIDLYRAGYLSKAAGVDLLKPESLVTHSVQFDFIWKF